MVADAQRSPRSMVAVNKMKRCMLTGNESTEAEAIQLITTISITMADRVEPTAGHFEAGISDASAKRLQFLQSTDGRRVPLVVQSLIDSSSLPEPAEWFRIGKPRSQVPSLIHVSNWIGAPTFKPGSEDRCFDSRAILTTCLRLFLAWPLLCILVMGFDFVKGATTSSNYDKVQTHETPRDHSPRSNSRALLHQEDDNRIPEARSEGLQVQPYSDNIRLSSELPPPQTDQHVRNSRYTTRSNQGGIAASLRPRYLCFIQDFEQGLYETRKVSDYIEQYGDHVDIEFVFISYTRMQFRVATDEEIDRYGYPDEETRAANKKLAKSDRQMLIKWGINAAKQAGKQAFWLDFECVRDEDGIARSTSNSDDVYRICDIVRAAHSMIIAIGPSTEEKIATILGKATETPFNPGNVTPWLRQWGSRLWTLPELLLCPNEYRIKLYCLGDDAEPKVLAKRNFAERAWDDAEAVKQLVDHYEGSAVLTQLNLIEVALGCFSRRKTDQFSQGDIAYALMGLLPHRHRPSINQTDSGFQAFAKLSQANDGEFLERLICLLPPGFNAPWYDTRDFWQANPSDIHPTNQVSEVLDHDTLVLEGVSGATIQWDSLDSPPNGLENSGVGGILVLGYMVTAVIPKFFACASLFVLVMDEFTPTGLRTPLGEIFGWLVWPVVILTSVFALVAPTILNFFRPKTTKSSRARLIGLEGFTDVGEVEKRLWGSDRGNFTLIPESQYYHDSEQMEIPAAEEGHRFTLVDTWMMTVTHVRCQRPPVAMLLCGHHAGMQRALLCSYDWQNNTFCRETVLRVGSRILDQMQRVGQVRLVLNSTQLDDHPEHPSNRTDSGLPIEQLRRNSKLLEDDASTFRDSTRTWIVEFIFLCLVFLAIGVFDANFSRLSLWLSSTSYVFYYYGGFLAAQPLAYFLITTVPTNRLFPCLALLKGWETIISAVFVNWSRSSLEIWSVSSGIINGLLLVTCITLIFSWFPSKQIPFRLLLIAGFGREIRRLFALAIDVHWGRVLFSLTILGYVAWCFLLATFGSSLIGRPLEVSWLAGHQRAFFSSRAALPTLEARLSTRNWKFLKQRPLYYYQLLSIFILSMASSITIIPGTTYSLRHEVVHLFVGIVLAFTLRRWAHLSVHVATGCAIVFTAFWILSAIGALSRSPSIFYQGIALGQLVLPLVWFVIVDSSTKQKEVISLLSFSLAGKAVGGILLRVMLDKPDFATPRVILFCIMGLTVAALMQVYGFLRRRSPNGSGLESLEEAGGPLRI